MQKIERLNTTKLLGFDSVGEAGGKVDLRGDAFEAKLGAKVGAETWAECEFSDNMVASAHISATSEG